LVALRQLVSEVVAEGSATAAALPLAALTTPEQPLVEEWLVPMLQLATQLPSSVATKLAVATVE